MLAFNLKVWVFYAVPAAARSLSLSDPVEAFTSPRKCTSVSARGAPFCCTALLVARHLLLPKMCTPLAHFGNPLCFATATHCIYKRKTRFITNQFLLFPTKALLLREPCAFRRFLVLLREGTEPLPYEFIQLHISHCRERIYPFRNGMHKCIPYNFVILQKFAFLSQGAENAAPTNVVPSTLSISHISLFYCSVHISLCVALCDCGAFIKVFLTPAKSKRKLDTLSFEIQL